MFVLKTGNPKKVFFIFIILALLFFMSACVSPGGIDYPDISYKEPDDSAISSIPNDQTAENPVYSGNLTVSLPMSEITLQYLTYLFIGKKSGLFTETNIDSSGLTITLENLEQFRKNSLSVSLIEGNSSGYTFEEIDLMHRAGTLPDIFLVDHTDILRKNRIVPADLSGSFLDSYVSPMNVYPQMFSDDPLAKEVFSVPYAAVVKMLYMNVELWIGTGVDPQHLVDSPINFDSLVILSEYLNQKDKDVYAWFDFKGLAAYLPSSIRPFPGSYCVVQNKIDFSNQAFSGTIGKIKTLASKSKVYEKPLINQTPNNQEQGHLIEQNIIGFWVDNSTKLEHWINTTKSVIRRYPLPVVDRITIPMTTVQIAVNPQSTNPILAKQLAIFFALDKDALLFRSRFDIPTGYIPPLKDLQVWEQTVLPQLQGNELFLLHELMDDAHIVYLNDQQKIVDAFGELYNDHIYDMLYRNKRLDENTDQLNTRIRSLLNE